MTNKIKKPLNFYQKNIKNFEKLGWKPANIAKELGIDNSAVHYWSTGRNDVLDKNKKGLKKLLKIDRNKSITEALDFVKNIGLSKQEMAQKLDLTYMTIHKWTQGQTPSYQSVKKILKFKKKWAKK